MSTPNNPFATPQGQAQGQGATPAPIIPDSPRTLPIEPIGMTASVEGESDRLCWAGPSGGSTQDPSQPPAPQQMPDLSTPDAVASYLKDNPQALWAMSKAEIIAMIAGPDAARAYVAGQPAPAATTTP